MGILAANSRLWQDAERLAHEESLPWSAIDGSVVLVTGATGLIGKNLCAALLVRQKEGKGPLRILGTSRHAAAIEELYGDSAIEAVSWNGIEPFRIDGGIDCIVHCAAPTASKFFIEKPVETIESIVDGSRAILELAREKCSKKAVLLSSMEVYGETSNGKVSEKDLGMLDPMEVRNSYPEAKRLSEALCKAYVEEYDVPALSLRLAQTFGPGVDKDDGRVFAYLMRCALQSEDIVLATDGSKCNPYISTMDVASAILFALAFGEPGEAYNVANEDTFVSVYEMACMVAESFGDDISVTKGSGQNSGLYRKASTLDLDSSKMRSLGWEPQVSLLEMFEALGEDWKVANV